MVLAMALLARMAKRDRDLENSHMGFLRDGFTFFTCELTRHEPSIHSGWAVQMKS